MSKMDQTFGGVIAQRADSAKLTDRAFVRAQDISSGLLAASERIGRALRWTGNRLRRHRVGLTQLVAAGAGLVAVAAAVRGGIELNTYGVVKTCVNALAELPNNTSGHSNAEGEAAVGGSAAAASVLSCFASLVFKQGRRNRRETATKSWLPYRTPYSARRPYGFTYTIQDLEAKRRYHEARSEMIEREIETNVNELRRQQLAREIADLFGDQLPRSSNVYASRSTSAYGVMELQPMRLPTVPTAIPETPTNGHQPNLNGHHYPVVPASVLVGAH